MTSDKKHVLVVDDEPSVASISAEFLRRGGFEVEIAADLQLAESKIKERRADLVLLDINMPDGDGFSFLRRIKIDHPELKIVFFTADVCNEQEVKRATESGASGYLSKLNDLHSMVTMVQRILRVQSST